MKPKMLINTTTDKDMKKGFTLSFLFSSTHCVTPFFNALSKMMIPLDDCHLIIYDNSDLSPLKIMLEDVANQLKDRFYSLRLFKSYRQGSCQTVMDRKTSNKPTKIPFIIDGYKSILKMVTTKVWINIEDDTIAPPHTVMRLLKDFESMGPDVFISGVEPHRMTTPYEKTRLGAYYFYTDGYALWQRVSLSPKCRGLKRVDACGHYCFITTKKIFRKGLLKMPMFLNNPYFVVFDGRHTYNLTRKGIPVYVDFNLRCLHMHPTPEGYIYASVKKAVSQTDYYIPQYKVWALGVDLGEDVISRPNFEKWELPKGKCPECTKGS